MKTINTMSIMLVVFAAGQFSLSAQPDAEAKPGQVITVKDGPLGYDVQLQAAPPIAGSFISVPTNNKAVSTNAPAVVAVTGTNSAAEPAPEDDLADVTPTNSVRMNFHDAPLGTVVKFLSKKMGLVVVSEVDLRGNATIVSEQPVNKNEVLELLSGALAKNNYNLTVSTNGRILTITAAESATTGSETPVREATSPTNIPVSEKIATYILPVQTLNPVQLIKDLDALIPAGAKVSANEAGNAVIMTAREKDIHRFSEIIAALDSSSVSDVRVYVCRYADAKSVAAELKEIFQSPDSTVARSDARSRRGGGFGGFGGMFGGGGGPGGGESGGESKNAATKAVFVSDDQMNAVISSAPVDFYRAITNVEMQLDQPSMEITVMRAFKLKHADAQETADELASLFPDSTSSDQNNRTAGMMFRPPWMQGPTTPQSNASDRMKRQTAVRAVADLRTASVIVTASKDMMEQIGAMITNLDEDKAGEKHVYAFDIDNADPVTAQAALTALFAGQNQRQPQNSTPSALQQRATTAAQQQTTTTSTSGTSGSGGGSAALH